MATFTFLHNDSRNDTAVLVGVVRPFRRLAITTPSGIRYDAALDVGRSGSHLPGEPCACWSRSWLTPSKCPNHQLVHTHKKPLVICLLPRSSPLLGLLANPNPSVCSAPLLICLALTMVMFLFIRFAHRSNSRHVLSKGPAWMHAGCV